MMKGSEQRNAIQIFVHIFMVRVCYIISSKNMFHKEFTEYFSPYFHCAIRILLRLTLQKIFRCTCIRTGIKLQGDWGEIVALEGSKSPWEAQRATKTSPSVFATFEKASTCAKRTSSWRKSSEK